MSDFNQFVYNAPTGGAYSKLVLDNPNGAFTVYAVVRFDDRH